MYASHSVSEFQTEGSKHPFKGTIVPDYGDLMLTKSTGLKTSVEGNCFLFLFCCYLKRETHPGLVRLGCCLQRENFPLTDVFDSNRFYLQNIYTFLLFLSPQIVIPRHCVHFTLSFDDILSLFNIVKKFQFHHI